VKEKQFVDLNLNNTLSLLNTNKAKDFSVGRGDILRFRNTICVIEDDELRGMVLSGYYESKFCLHHKMTKLEIPLWKWNDIFKYFITPCHIE